MLKCRICACKDSVYTGQTSIWPFYKCRLNQHIRNFWNAANNKENKNSTPIASIVFEHFLSEHNNLTYFTKRKKLRKKFKFEDLFSWNIEIDYNKISRSKSINYFEDYVAYKWKNAPNTNMLNKDSMLVSKF